VRPTRFLAGSQDFPIPLPRKLDVLVGSLPGPFLKGVQDIDPFGKLRHVEDPMLSASVDSQFINTRSYTGNGLPVIRLKPLLNQVQVVTGHASRGFGKGSQVLESGADPKELFHGRAVAYKFLYIEAKGSWPFRGER
jgi:hypothetical protein